MNPEQLSAQHSESGEQKALFAWAAMAQLHGFSIADNMDAYTAIGLGRIRRDLSAFDMPKGIAVLRWLHSIPNGGARDPVTAARMKAEGARAGIPDVFLPVAKWVSPSYCFHGLYIEMKKPKVAGKSAGKQSAEQKEFEDYCLKEGFAYHVCYTWREAADVLKEYLLRK